MLQSNEYFDGKVKSIGFTSSSTGRASVGVMAEGEYTFGTAQPEEMTVVSGALNVLLPGETGVESLRCRRSFQCARQQRISSAGG
ncbi:protein YaiE [Klebsiella pneumoniae]|nr:protein YaiE [Klebsiella pneumoniae]